MGVSRRTMFEVLIAGRADATTMVELARGRMRTKISVLAQALTGVVREHHRRLLVIQLAHVDFLDEHIATLSEEIRHVLSVLCPNEPLGSTTADAGAPPTAPESSPSASPMTFIRAI